MIDSDDRFLTDENVHPKVVSFLREQGCDVLDVKELGQEGSADRELVRQAATDGRTILTHDRDFGRLMMAQRGMSVAVIYLRPGHIDPEFTIGTLRALFEYERPDPPFIVVAERKKQQVRVRIRDIG